MFYTVYRVTNLLNGMHYVGAHSTHDAMDGYIGSGVRLRAAVRKYGRENFRKEILRYCESAREMFVAESALVEIGPRSYNLKSGGSGGSAHHEETKRRISITMRGRAPNTAGRACSDARKNRVANSMVGKRNALGLKHSDEWKAAASKRNAGNTNAAGTTWTPEQRARLATAQQARRERERSART